MGFKSDSSGLNENTLSTEGEALLEEKYQVYGYRYVIVGLFCMSYMVMTILITTFNPVAAIVADVSI
jgi:hypothetical protein